MTIRHASLSRIQDVGRLMRRKLRHRNAKPALELRVLYTFGLKEKQHLKLLKEPA